VRRFFARSFKTRHVPGKMNSLEKKFADHLRSLEIAGKVLWWRFEPIRLRLTIQDKTTTYTPDFVVLMSSGEIEVYETKGFWTSAARVKTKVAADLYWFWRFYGAKNTKKTGWVYEEFSSEGE